MSPLSATPRATVRGPLVLAGLSLRRPLLLTALALAVASSACGEDARTLACPLLAPGALTLFGQGQSLAPVASDAADTAGAVSGQVAAAALSAHAVWLRKGEEVKVRALTQTFGAELELVAYGPRDAFGGLPFCGGITSGQSASLTIKADADGEWVVLVGSLPGGDALEYSVRATCEAGCDASAPRCPTLAERGCGATRCDGELTRDAAGCLTCACETGALCSPDRAAGPGGSCVLPACQCDDAAGGAVCGADGQTWASACAANCAAVPVAKAGPCEIACPALAACEAPCFGLRALGPDGCPTCECGSRFAAEAASCAACPLDEAPVCGSDGVTYPNACRARCAGAKILYAAACTDGCRAAPAGCALDCAFGLRPVAGGESCLACACADLPTSCEVSGAPVCATLPGPIGATTIGSACVALALGASDGVWGPCGVNCDDEVACPEGSSCREAGFLAGRCLVDADAASQEGCGCGSLLEPVCGDDGEALRTFANRCLARCAGARVLHGGACCEAFAGCDEGAPAVDSRGCPATCGDTRQSDCAANAATTQACGPDQDPLTTSACAAHFAGLFASTEACP